MIFKIIFTIIINTQNFKIVIKKIKVEKLIINY